MALPSALRPACHTGCPVLPITHEGAQGPVKDPDAPLLASCKDALCPAGGLTEGVLQMGGAAGVAATEEVRITLQPVKGMLMHCIPRGT